MFKIQYSSRKPAPESAEFVTFTNWGLSSFYNISFIQWACAIASPLIINLSISATVRCKLQSIKVCKWHAYHSDTKHENSNIYVVFFCFQSCVGEIFFVHKIYPRDTTSHLNLRFKATVVYTNSFFTYTGKVNYRSRASIHKAFFIDISK